MCLKEMLMEIKEMAIERMKRIFGEDIRRINHALKVLRFSEEIMESEIKKEQFGDIITLTAILHDIGIHEAEKKYNSNSGKYQEIEGPPIARKVMEELNLNKILLERVCYIIGGHHTASKIDGIDFQIIWEADLLVNIEEDGLNKKNTNLKKIIDKNFKTKTGKSIAEKLYLK
jgi:HD superfamily phosphodiesterase